jgi:hypothetical protein
MLVNKYTTLSSYRRKPMEKDIGSHKGDDIKKSIELKSRPIFKQKDQILLKPAWCGQDTVTSSLQVSSPLVYRKSTAVTV